MYELTPATELTGHEAPGVPKSSGKYTSDDFKVGDGKKPWERDTAEDDDLKEIEAMIRQAGQCLPGQDCNNLPQGEQITKDSPNNPVNQVSLDSSGTGAAGGAGGDFGKPPAQQSGDNTGGSLKPQTQALQDSLKGLFPDAEIGGWREPDGYNEHSSGSALDFMTTDHGQAKQVMDHAFDNGAKFVIWDQKQWNPDGSTSAMPDRGDPTQNHKDHVHINTGSRIAAPTDDYETWKAEFGQAADDEGTHGFSERFPSWEHKRWLDHQDKLQRKLTASSPLVDDYLDYMYGEYGGTDWDVPNSPTDVMYNEADHGRGHGFGGGPSGPGGPPLHHSTKTAARIPRQLKGLVSAWTPYVNPDLQINPLQRPATPPDPNLPVFVHFQIPAADRQRKALRHHLNDPGDPGHDPSRPSLSREQAGRLAEQPDLWSIEQVNPETGKRQVRGHTNQLHLQNVSFDYNRSGQKATQTSGKKGVHAGVSGYMTPQPDQPLAYSNVEYNPFQHMDFVHRDGQTPVGDPEDWTRPRGGRAESTPPGFRSNGVADHVHLTPDMQTYAHRADNFGVDPKIVFPPHPSVNAANPDTLVPGAKPGPQHPEVAARTKDVLEKRRLLDQAKGRSVVGMLKVARRRALKLAFGETEAPMAVDTLREEGSAPEDDDDDFEQYVKSPGDLKTPDLSQAQQIDREQEAAGAPTDATGGVPGAAEGGPVPGQAPQQQYLTLQIPMPSEVPQIPQQAAPPVMMQPPADPAAMDPAAPQAPPQQIAASVLDYFDRYYGHRVANWMDAIEDGRDLNPAEAADYRRQAVKLSTLENGRELSTTTRNPTKGTANMARNSIANRNQVATAGRRQHFAEGPLVDGGDRSRNDQGEQEEAFISQTPPEGRVDYPEASDPDISNTEHNLVARVQQGRNQLLRDAQQLASLRQRRAFDEAGGPTAEVVDPRVRDSASEELTGDGFVSANPNDGVVPTNPKDASLRAFQAFDGWLNAKTGKSSRRHTEATIKKAAAAFSREAGISPQMLFPALGIVLREARKNDKKATKGAAMRKRSNESLDVAAPDGRIDVETPVKNTDAEAQASQFDIHDFGNNAGDKVAKPDLSTDQNWAPGEASKTSARVKTAGGLLAMRCAEGMITAGLEPNSRERKYQLAAEFENMNRGLIQDRVALLERFAAVRQADLRRVASGSSRGAARSPIPAGLGGGTRTAAAGQRLAAHDPSNDSSLFI